MQLSKSGTQDWGAAHLATLNEERPAPHAICGQKGRKSPPGPPSMRQQHLLALLGYDIRFASSLRSPHPWLSNSCAQMLNLRTTCNQMIAQWWEWSHHHRICIDTQCNLALPQLRPRINSCLPPVHVGRWTLALPIPLPNGRKIGFQCAVLCDGMLTTTSKHQRSTRATPLPAICFTASSANSINRLEETIRRVDMDSCFMQTALCCGVTASTAPLVT